MDKVVLSGSQFDLWKQRAEQQISKLSRLTGDARIEHIGSTSVPGLPAKDVVDILIGVPAREIQKLAGILQRNGYDLEGDYPEHCWLSQPSRKERTSIVHIVELGSRRWHRRIQFRDLLRQNPEAREKYLAVKRKAAESSDNWDEYTQSKTAVVNELLARI